MPLPQRNSFHFTHCKRKVRYAALTQFDSMSLSHTYTLVSSVFSSCSHLLHFLGFRSTKKKFQEISSSTMSLSSTGSIFPLRSEILDIAYDWYICVPVLAYTPSFYRFLPIAYRLFINVHSPSYVYSIICLIYFFGFFCCCCCLVRVFRC